MLELLVVCRVVWGYKVEIVWFQVCQVYTEQDFRVKSLDRRHDEVKSNRVKSLHVSTHSFSERMVNLIVKIVPLSDDLIPTRSDPDSGPDSGRPGSGGRYFWDE